MKSAPFLATFSFFAVICMMSFPLAGPERFRDFLKKDFGHANMTVQ
jgi:hypothetical protein